MEDGQKPLRGSRWAYKDVTYKVSGAEGLRVKDPSDANWHDAISYIRDDGSVELIFVRRLDDFLAKFVEVTD